LKVFATAVNRIEGLAIGPDHAALFETTLMASLRPDLVQLGNLKTIAEAPLPVEENPFGAQRHEPTHPLYGIFGPDPRAFKHDQAGPLLEASVHWLVAKVRASITSKI